MGQTRPAVKSRTGGGPKEVDYSLICYLTYVIVHFSTVLIVFCFVVISSIESITHTHFV